MRNPMFVLALLVTACSSEQKFTGKDPVDTVPSDGVPTVDTAPETTPETTPTTTTPTTPTTPTTDTTTTPPPPPSQPPVPCPYGIDLPAVADCAAGGDAAYTGGVGFATIQQAVNQAGQGDTITVCPGTWPGGVVLGGHRILAAADPTPGVTTLDGGGAIGLLDVTNATVQGLTLRDGALNGGAAAIRATDTVLLECVVVDDNDGIGGYSTGGAIIADDLTIRYSAFGRNRALYAGGAIDAKRLVVEDTSFEDNYAGYEGGALVVSESVTIVRSFFTANEADYSGGALSVGGFDPVQVSITDSSFDGNIAGYSGGAVEIGAWETDPTTITNTTFTGNLAVYGVGAVDLGTWGGVDLTVTGCTFSANEGGPAGALGSSGWIDDGGVITLGSSVFEDNRSLVTGGGFLYLWDQNGAFTITGTDLTVLRNSGSDGAVALGATEHLFDCTNCDFGTGADDNLPGDATKAGVQTADLPLTFVL